MNKKILLILALLVFVCAVAHASAAEVSDDADDAIAANESDKVSLEDDVDVDEKLSESSSDIIANGTGDTPNESSTSTANNTKPVVEKQTAVIKVSKAKVGYKKGTKWKIKVVDSKNRPIAKTKILLKVYTGSKYKTAKLWTNAKGVASYNTKSLKAGTHKVIVSLAGNTYKFKAVKSSIKVVKQTALKILAKTTTMDEGALLTVLVMNKKTKKLVNGVKLKLLLYTGKKYKTITIKTKNFNGVSGMAGYATNQLSVGKHVVKIIPVKFKYDGYKKTSMVIKKSAKRSSPWSIKL